MLWKLLSRIDRARFEPYVFALSSHADGMLDRFNEIGINCRFLGMRPRADAAAGLFRLGQALRHLTPDIVQGWLYHGNLAATLASVLIGGRPPVLWSIRCTLPSKLLQEKWQSALTIWIGGKLSFSATKIIHNSMSSAVEHEQRLGYRGDHRIVVPNGFDTNVFRPSPEARLSVRRMLGIPQDVVLVGLIGRYHAQKDHDNFLRAAALLKPTHPEVHFLLAGEGVGPANAALNGLIRDVGLCQRAHLLGPRDDIPAITAALDIACCSSSYGEGFANVIGEAMSCAVVCAVTDVSDAAHIVSDTGRVVPPRNPQALARALRDLLDMGEANRQTLGLRARERVINNFSLDAVVRQYEEVYLSVYEQSMRARKR
jgi:glycosyltransferase involved in cell wall biosynthesis